MFELLESTEKLVIEAERHISSLKKCDETKNLVRISELIARCENTRKVIFERKEEILTLLVKIALLTGSMRYEKADALDRDYWINFEEDKYDSEHRISYSNNPCWANVSVQTFVRLSMTDDPNRLNFNAFCSAIIDGAVGYLQVAPQKNMSRISELEKLLAEIKEKLHPFILES